MGSGIAQQHVGICVIGVEDEVLIGESIIAYAKGQSFLAFAFAQVHLILFTGLDESKRVPLRVGLRAVLLFALDHFVAKSLFKFESIEKFDVLSGEVILIVKVVNETFSFRGQ
jgi:hypothetical protein